MGEDAKNTMPRRGPNPLPMHVGLALAEYARVQHKGGVPQQKMEDMLAGIRKYQNHPYRRNMTPLPVVWQRGEVSILHARAEQPVAALLLVPSLINKSFILDLLPDKSFARWLAQQGIDTFLLDWGAPVSDAGLGDIDSLVTQRLGPAIADLAARAGGKIHALGYCMGGTLLAAASLHSTEFLRGAVFLASPWDFDAGDRKLADQVRAGTPNALQMAEQNGHLPMDWIQSVFAAVNAGRALQKFSEFAALDDDSAGARLFVAVEDWLNDGIDMPKDLARTCVVEWYGENRPGERCWEVAGEVMDLAALDVPALVVASLNDRLVPKESSLAMAQLLPRANVLEPSSGHIGMMTGGRAEEQVWQPVARWIKESA